MWVTVAKHADVKVMYHTIQNKAVMLTNGTRPCYAPTPIEVILFEDRPYIQSELRKKVLKWKSGYLMGTINN